MGYSQLELKRDDTRGGGGGLDEKTCNFCLVNEKEDECHFYWIVLHVSASSFERNNIIISDAIKHFWCLT